VKKLENTKQTRNIKLKIERDTLRTLRDKELRQVAGGNYETGASGEAVCCA
jgi:hypothetical protein